MTRERDFSSRPRARRLSRGQSALVVAGLGALAFAAWATVDAWTAQAAAAARLTQTRRETEALLSRVRDLRGRGGPDGALAARAMLTADAAPPRVLARLAEMLPGDVRLDAVSLDYGEHVELELRVAARSPASFDLFVDRLQRSPSFTRVLTGEEDRRGGMSTTVRGRFRAGGR
ncbi:MAG TPA: hypothetical protein VMT87_14490 [Vicinamibacteria bacterium]|nr:hypothetical protein [Vicinamibacteria bacterium]